MNFLHLDLLGGEPESRIVRKAGEVMVHVLKHHVDASLGLAVL